LNSDIATHGLFACGQERVRVDGKLLARGEHRFRVQGVTYGPFVLNEQGQPFPEPDRVCDDFARMRSAGINSIRIYDLPPEWFLDLADEQTIAIFLDVPWPKHLCFLEYSSARVEARRLVRHAATLGRDHSCILAYSIGNEIPPDVVRWHGARRVVRFLSELRDVVKQADAEGLVTYANYPPTEYLDPSFLDFVTFNVYLHDREPFRHYLFRLQNLVGDKPLLLGEIGMDSLRNGERAQADFLAGHTREAMLMGLVGTFVFSWTDEWYTGGHPIEDWAFGITDADRAPKPSFHALREVFRHSPAALLPDAPRVSVVVCTYNGGRTLERCLDSLLDIDYPDYEVIVVDDGSIDDTRDIVSRFPGIKTIHQANRGLGVARNVGLSVATGSIVAYTDSDCCADRDWLTQLVSQLGRSDAAAVGGPNLTPEDGWLAACVAASPGQPTHVLVSDQVAEHIPGCNMAFHREALAAINGFDPQFSKAGDDVDICWRLQQAGFWITFAPGALVWHHRRQNPISYLKQQVGYGEAEALLRFIHPDRFNGRGEGKWRGVLYGPSFQGPRFSRPIIHRGTFGAGLFQCLYQPAPAHWAMLPSTPEWHLVIALVGLLAIVWPIAWIGVGAMFGLSLGIAALQAAQASLAPEHDRLLSRLLIAALSYAQPLVRSSQRYWTRLFAHRAPAPIGPAVNPCRRLPLSGVHGAAYWSEVGHERTELLGLVIAYLIQHRWAHVIDSGWSDRDLEIHCNSWTTLELRTAQEENGGGKRLIRIRYRLRPNGPMKVIGLVAALCAMAAVFARTWPAAVNAGVLLAAGLGLWWRGTRLAAHAVGVVDALARGMGLIPLHAAAPTVGPGRSQAVNTEDVQPRRPEDTRPEVPMNRMVLRSVPVAGVGGGRKIS
jgi:GT2 family glycosyltransferase